MSKISDEDLMWQLSQGKLKYAGHLFERYHVRLYNFFLRWNNDRALSEDLTQSVFERLIRYRKTYKKGMSLKSWIFQIARNVKADQAKSNRLLISDFVSPESIDPGEAPFTEKMEKAEEVSALQRAIRQLSSEQQEILELTRFQKMKYKEVALLLGYSEGAIKVKVHRAIQTLKVHYLKAAKL